MKILLLRPRPSEETIGLQHVMLTEPLELEVLGALARPGDRVKIVDLTLEKRSAAWFLRKEKPDLVGVTGYITNVPAMIDICRQAKRIDPTVRTVVGGVHVEVCPEHLDDPAIDFRVARNATTVFTPLLDHIEGKGPLPAGVLTPGQSCRPDELPPFDFSYPLPDRSLTERYRHRYFYIFHDKVALVKTAFGCPFTCSFCFCREVTGGRYHPRPMAEVLEELAGIPQREIYIVDDDFFVSRARLTEFLDAIEAAGIRKRYLVYGRADFIAHNRDLIERFKSLGLRTVIVGFESFIERDLQDYDKRTQVAANRATMQICNELKIDVFATIVVSPEWRREDFDLHARVFRELDINYVNLQPLTPLPGTGVEVAPRDQLLAAGDFVRWDLAHLSVRPKHMSPAQFYREIIRLYMSTLYRPRYLMSYLKYRPRLWLKILQGSLRVRQQYRRKLEEAERAEVR